MDRNAPREDGLADADIIESAQHRQRRSESDDATCEQCTRDADGESDKQIRREVVRIYKRAQQGPEARSRSESMPPPDTARSMTTTSPRMAPFHCEFRVR